MNKITNLVWVVLICFCCFHAGQTALEASQQACGSPLHTYTLYTGETALLCAIPVTFLYEKRGETREMTRRLFYVNIHHPDSDTMRRVWQQRFHDTGPLLPRSFTFGSADSEQRLALGYIEGSDVYVYVLDITASLVPFEEQRYVKSKPMPKIENWEEALFPPCRVGLPKLFDLKEFAKLKHNGMTIESLTYSQQGWSLVLRMSGKLIEFRGELQRGKVKWSVINKEK